MAFASDLPRFCQSPTHAMRSKSDLRRTLVSKPRHKGLPARKAACGNNDVSGTKAYMVDHLEQNHQMLCLGCKGYVVENMIQ